MLKLFYNYKIILLSSAFPIQFEGIFIEIYVHQTTYILLSRKIEGTCRIFVNILTAHKINSPRKFLAVFLGGITTNHLLIWTLTQFLRIVLAWKSLEGTQTNTIFSRVQSCYKLRIYFGPKYIYPFLKFHICLTFLITIKLYSLLPYHTNYSRECIIQFQEKYVCFSHSLIH